MSRRSAGRSRVKKTHRNFSREALRANQERILGECLHRYSGETVGYLRDINQILNNSRGVVAELGCWAAEEMLERVFEEAEGRRELGELTEYYKFYLNTPVALGRQEGQMMGRYWSRSKALYYATVKKMLHLQESSECFDQNIEQSQGYYLG